MTIPLLSTARDPLLDSRLCGDPARRARPPHTCRGRARDRARPSGRFFRRRAGGASRPTEFDDLARLAPDEAPYLWQRGIAQYYAGRFRECRAQFESHRTVNPDDVENAAWHFLCVARGESVAAARAALLPVGPDARVPMREIYQMFRGVIDPTR